MLTLRDEPFADRVRALRLHGLDRDAWKRYKRQGPGRDDVVEPGYKYNLSDRTPASRSGSCTASRSTTHAAPRRRRATTRAWRDCRASRRSAASSARGRATHITCT